MPLILFGDQNSSGIIETDVLDGYTWTFRAQPSEQTGLSDGDAVATLEDLSGNNRDATQGTSAMQPIYLDSVANGKPALRFDGFDDYLDISSDGAMPSGDTDMTAYTVMRKPYLSEGYSWWAGVTGTRTANGFYHNGVYGSWIWWGSDLAKVRVDTCLTTNGAANSLVTAPQAIFDGEGPRTVEIWFKADVEQAANFVDAATSGTAHESFAIGVLEAGGITSQTFENSIDGIHLTFWSNDLWAPAQGVFVGWNHVMIAWDGALEVRIMVNGSFPPLRYAERDWGFEQQPIRLETQPTPDWQDILIGGGSGSLWGNDQYFDGDLAHASFYRKYLSKERMEAHWEAATQTFSSTTYQAEVLADEPEAYYQFQETSGATASDEMGNHDATYGGSVTTYDNLGPVIDKREKFYVLTTRYDAATSTRDWYVNNTQWVTDTPSDKATPDSNNTIGARGDGSITEHLEFDLAALVIANEAHDNTERAEITNYLLGLYENWTPGTRTAAQLKLDADIHLDALSLDATLSNNDPVDTWASSSTSGISATAASTERPLWIENAYGTLPAVRFDGSNDYINIDSLSTALSKSESLTIFIVAYIDADNTGNNCLFSCHDGSGTNRLVFMDKSVETNQQFFYVASDTVFEDFLESETANSRVAVYALRKGAVDQIRKDGNVVYGMDPIGDFNSSTITQVSIGQEYDGVTKSDFLKGDIFEVIVFNEFLPENEFEVLEQDLITKYTPQISTILDGAVVHFNADDLVATDGDALATWDDSSANGFDATQATGSKQPIYVENGIGGLPSVLFDGTDDMMAADGAAATFAASSSLTVFSVVKPISPNNDAIFGLHTSSGGNRYADIVLDIDSHRIVSDDVSDTDAYFPYNGWAKIYTGRHNGTDRLFRDHRVTSYEVTESYTNGDITQVSIAQEYDGASESDHFNGYISEIIAFDYAMSIGEIEQIEEYLHAKYFERTPVARLGYIGDIHFADKDATTLSFRDGDDKLTNAIAAFNAEACDIVVLNGDLVDHDTPADSGTDAGDLATLKTIADGFDNSWYSTMGNHDLNNIDKAAFKTATGQSADYYFVDLNGIRFFFLDPNNKTDSDSDPYDSGNFDSADFYINPAQRTWLTTNLASAPGAAIVISHQPLDGSVGNAGTLTNASTVRGILETSGKVRTVIAGHNHTNAASVINDITYINMEDSATGTFPDTVGYGIVDIFSNGDVKITGRGVQDNYDHLTQTI